MAYFVLGVAASIMGQYKQNFAALWGVSTIADGSYDVSAVVAVIAAIGLVAAQNLPFYSIFVATAVIILVDGIFLCFLPFPPFEKAVKTGNKPKEKVHFTPSAVALGFTTSTTFMLWMNCNQELGKLYGLADPSKIQSFYSAGIVLALFVSAALLGKKMKPVKILVAYPAPRW